MTSRNWIGTWNNPPNGENDLKDLMADQNVKYIVGQLEMGESGTEHL